MGVRFGLCSQNRNWMLLLTICVIVGNYVTSLGPNFNYNVRIIMLTS